jgi:hypothetical protein
MRRNKMGFTMFMCWVGVCCGYIFAYVLNERKNANILNCIEVDKAPFIHEEDEYKVVWKINMSHGENTKLMVTTFRKPYLFNRIEFLENELKEIKNYIEEKNNGVS